MYLSTVLRTNRENKTNVSSPLVTRRNSAGSYIVLFPRWTWTMKKDVASDGSTGPLCLLWHPSKATGIDYKGIACRNVEPVLQLGEKCQLSNFFLHLLLLLLLFLLLHSCIGCLRNKRLHFHAVTRGDTLPLHFVTSVCRLALLVDRLCIYF